MEREERATAHDSEERDRETGMRTMLLQLEDVARTQGFREAVRTEKLAKVVGALRGILALLQEIVSRPREDDSSHKATQEGAALTHPLLLDSSTEEVSALLTLTAITPLRFLEYVGYEDTPDGLLLRDPWSPYAREGIECGLRALKWLEDRMNGVANPERSASVESGKILRDTANSSAIIDERIADLLERQQTNNIPQEDRCVGAMLACMMGDALGAGVEGYSHEMIHDMFTKTNGRVLGYINASHMGVRKLGLRYGMYTDDTQTTLALATSIVENQALVPAHAAHRYYEFFCTKPQRGYPPTAQAVLLAVSKGTDYRATGTIAFPDGSYANGGAMRIAPVGMAFRNATLEELRTAVRWAIISSHVHAQAVDAAYLQALSVAMFANMSEEEKQSFQPLDYLTRMRKEAETLPMKKRIKTMIEKLEASADVDDMAVLDEITESEFQIKAVDAMAVVLWAVARYWKDPADCIIRTVGFGGDTDTTAAMVGALMGAMHGTSWMPRHWYDNLENGEYGRDYCVRIGRPFTERRGLAALDLHTVKLDEPSARGVEWV